MPKFPAQRGNRPPTPIIIHRPKVYRWFQSHPTGTQTTSSSPLPTLDGRPILNMTTASPDTASGRAAAAAGKPPAAELKPTLPLDVLGHALDYAPYGDVQSALSVSKTVRSEATKAIKVLNFTRGAQLGHRSSGRYFPNVTEVNCLSFATVSPHLGFGAVKKATLCMVTYHRLVPFLSTFPKLYRVFIGGLEKGFLGQQDSFLTRTHITYAGHFGTNENLYCEQIEAFFDQLLNAFQSKLLPSSLQFMDGVNEILGSGDPFGFCHGVRNDDRICARCHAVCVHFPIVNVMSWVDRCKCIGPISYHEAVVDVRQEARELFRENEICMAWAVRTLLRMHKGFGLRAMGGDDWEEKVALQRKLFRLGVIADDFITISGFPGFSIFGQAKHSAIPCVYYITNRDFARLDRLIAVGFDPSAIQWHTKAARQLSSFSSRAVVRSTVTKLSSRGFHLPKAIIVDERVELALKNVPALLKGEIVARPTVFGMPPPRPF